MDPGFRKASPRLRAGNFFRPGGDLDPARIPAQVEDAWEVISQVAWMKAGEIARGVGFSDAASVCAER
jgi:hypothetical protein